MMMKIQKYKESDADMLLTDVCIVSLPCSKFLYVLCSFNIFSYTCITSKYYKSI